jgi:hypothetical protein
MKKLLMLIVLLMVATLAYALEPVKLIGITAVELTDGAPTYNAVIVSEHYQDVIVDVVSDKGGTLVIYPIPDENNITSLGLVSDTLTVADGGPAGRGGYTKLASPRAKILFTKTEAGTTSGFKVIVHGVLY